MPVLVLQRAVRAFPKHAVFELHRQRRPVFHCVSQQQAQPSCALRTCVGAVARQVSGAVDAQPVRMAASDTPVSVLHVGYAPSVVLQSRLDARLRSVIGAAEGLVLPKGHGEVGEGRHGGAELGEAVVVECQRVVVVEARMLRRTHGRRGRARVAHFFDARCVFCSAEKGPPLSHRTRWFRCVHGTTSVYFWKSWSAEGTAIPVSLPARCLGTGVAGAGLSGQVMEPFPTNSTMGCEAPTSSQSDGVLYCPDRREGRASVG